MENTNSNMHKNDNSYVLSALSYLSIFFAPVILPLFVWILADEPTSEHGKKAFINHIMTWVSFFIGRLAFIFSKEVFDIVSMCCYNQYKIKKDLRIYIIIHNRSE
ncbi:hypothetical protein M8385_14965 [Staphylococcus aureus]|uniref:hypothetical protein n=1 Tax=Staphylococcus aureus TaxID=1280 RepID=UPI0020213EA8|nr:hypothetical protein [Staphylococcus aureus]MCL7607760.1 hypothetical protein [Staphylococcus aureus]